jgi:hypothetical protein
MYKNGVTPQNWLLFLKSREKLHRFLSKYSQKNLRKIFPKDGKEVHQCPKNVYCVLIE